MKRTWSGPTFIAFLLSAAGLLLIIIFAVNKSFNDWSWHIAPSLASEYGGFIGGVVGPILTFAGMLLIYETIVVQRTTFQMQQFETKFFEMIRWHRENVAQMTHRIPWSKEERYYHGPQVFIEMKSQFEKILAIVHPLVRKHYNVQGDEKETEAINFSYIVLFIGVGKSSRATLNEHLQDQGFDNTMIDPIIDELRGKKTAYNINLVYFGGHQVRLAHYFILLFQAVSYVDKASFLNEKEKYDFVKTLRGKITKYEFAIFFVNSLSFGRKWEGNGNKFITRFSLLKHMPPQFIKGINTDNYYKPNDLAAQISPFG